MHVLAMDTSTERGSLALGRDAEVLESALLPQGWRSTTLHREIEALLERHGLTTGDLDGYAATSGPGSFTGVRLGLTAAKGLAEVHGKPVVAVSTLEMLAIAAQLQSPPPKPATLAAILDARRGQVFGGVYREENGRWRALIEEAVSSLASFLERIRSAARITEPQALEPMQNLAFCGLDLESFIPEIEKSGWSSTPMIDVLPCLAAPLAQFATRRIEQGLGEEAAGVGANYVRLSDAELFCSE